MEIIINELTETRKAVEIRIPAQDIKAEEKKLVREFGQQAKIPGFRPGKAPEAMLRKRFGSALADELKRSLLRKSYEKLTSEDSLKIVQIVEFDDSVSFQPDEDTTIAAQVDVRPDFTLPGYEGLELQAQGVEVSDEEIDQMIERIRSERADYVKVDREAQQGDYVQCSYQGFLAGEPIDDLVKERPLYGTQKNTWEEAGAADGMGIPAITAALPGMAVGESKEVVMSYPADHAVENLRGKDVKYQVEVHEVREKKLPEIDETFLKTLQVESEEKLRENVRNQLKMRKEQENEEHLRRQIVEKLTAAADFPLPESVVQSRTESILTDYMMSQMQRGASEEDFEKVREQLHESAGQSARNQVKLDFILQEIMDREKVTLEQEDMQRVLINEAMRTRQNPEDLVKELRKDEGRRRALQRSALTGKTMAMILEKAQVQPAEASASSGED